MLILSCIFPIWSILRYVFSITDFHVCATEEHAKAILSYQSSGWPTTLKCTKRGFLPHHVSKHRYYEAKYWNKLRPENIAYLANSNSQDTGVRRLPRCHFSSFPNCTITMQRKHCFICTRLHLHHNIWRYYVNYFNLS